MRKLIRTTGGILLALGLVSGFYGLGKFGKARERETQGGVRVDAQGKMTGALEVDTLDELGAADAGMILGAAAVVALTGSVMLISGGSRRRHAKSG